MREKYSKSKKSTYGQNFIYDFDLLESLVNRCDISSEDIILEIGAGAGTLTEVLSKKCKKVYSLEIDTNLISNLKSLENKYNNITIINADFIEWDMDSYFENQTIKVIANIPYYITSAIYNKLIFSNVNILEIACMVQLEVANKIIATPANKDSYSYLSLLCQHKYEAKILEVVDKTKFTPIPKVDSAFVRLTKKEIETSINFDKTYYSIVKNAFLHRRKTFLNSMSSSGYDIERLENILLELNIDSKIRPEKLYYNDYINIAKKYIK